MEILLRFECPACRKTFLVDDDQVEGDGLACPHCGADVPVPEDDEYD